MNNKRRKELLLDLKRKKEEQLIDLEVAKDFNRSLLLLPEQEEERVRNLIRQQEQQIRITQGLIIKIDEKLSQCE